jgi:chitinase
MSHKPVIAAYVPGWKAWSAADIEGRKLTHILYAFANIRDGDVVLWSEARTPVVAQQEGRDPKEVAAELNGLAENGLTALRELKFAYSGLRTLVSIGGWAADGFSDAADSVAGRERFADSAIAFMQRYGFDGIDLDWEYPCNDMASIKARPDDKRNFTLLLQVLRDKLDALSRAEGRGPHNSYALTIAAGVGQYYVDGIELHRVAPLLDLIFLMTYDLFNGWAKSSGHHASLYPWCDKTIDTGWNHDAQRDSVEQAVALFTANGAPPEKLVIGVPFYGRGLEGVPNTNHGLGQPGRPDTNFTLSYTDIARLLAENRGYRRYWDDRAQVPYLYDGDRFISYEDAESIAKKAKYVKANRLAGIMFWEYTQDESGTLLNAIHRQLHGSEQ